MFGEMTWFNEPPEWSSEGGRLLVSTGAETDFWRTTFYGFERDNGHFFFRRVTGDFFASITIEGRYEELYDQCGLMVRAGPGTWLKTGVEYTDGAENLSAVVTREFSDWSIAPSPAPGEPVAVRVSRHGDCVRAEYSVGRTGWTMLRLAYLGMPETVDVGAMCCSPRRAGFRVEFSDFALGPPITTLHE